MTPQQIVEQWRRRVAELRKANKTTCCYAQADEIEKCANELESLLAALTTQDPTPTPKPQPIQSYAEFEQLPLL